LGKVKVEFTGDIYNYYFVKTGEYKGAGFGSHAYKENTYEEREDGEKVFIEDGKYIYLEGRRMTADEDLKYEAYSAWGEEAKTGDDVTDGDFYLINTSGSIQKNRRNLKDREDNYYCTDSDGVITYFGTEECENHNRDEKHE
ncbi:MAG TPA: hypothetical protein IAA17_00570, partial [Candidatus Lachnoclostridium stercorigallinarum]|nr:hypothetical protein [Candidatus Lachnoclostridium stercorigallinarum]